MSNDWGQDFDEDGNVLGEVPEGDGGFLREHWLAVVIATLAVFLVNVPRLPDGGAGVMAGAVTGGLLASIVIGVPLAYIAVWLRGQF